MAVLASYKKVMPVVLMQMHATQTEPVNAVTEHRGTCMQWFEIDFGFPAWMLGVSGAGR